jgi:hypothetical protein
VPSGVGESGKIRLTIQGFILDMLGKRIVSDLPSDLPADLSSAMISLIFQ